MRVRMAGFVLLVLAPGVAPGVAWGACSNASANAKAQEMGAVLKQKMPAKPDEAGDIASDFGDVMAEAGKSGVTEQTCTQLDALLRKAKAL